METTETNFKDLVVMDRGNSQHRLTVTPTRITVKYKTGSSRDERNSVFAFFMHVAAQPEMKDCENSFRGSRTVNYSGDNCIIMSANTKRSPTTHTYRQPND
jgi:hypothetical protein